MSEQDMRCGACGTVVHPNQGLPYYFLKDGTPMHSNSAICASAWQARAERAEARVQELEKLLNDVQEAACYRGENDYMRITDLEAALRTLVVAASELLEAGPPSDAEDARWSCCGVHWDQAHTSNCPFAATHKAIAEARAALPQSEQEGVKGG